ncbi:N-6 DNA methylase [Brevundimonas sp. NPDC092305]|uniref:class I SAM-dependent DNA methyltransferase n=1 Tax=Brevundimonas sp. NPDC092305 TaxID=3363957 RepID=UPI00381AF0EE
MTSDPSAPADVRAIVQRLWSYCHVLKDDGVSYGDYVEQLTFLLFLKMEDETVRDANRISKLPKGARWNDLLGLSGLDLEAKYIDVLQILAHQPGVVGRIFARAQNKIQDSAKLKRLVTLIDSERWSNMTVDVKGAIYEGLLERNAEDVKSGAGQYFTPRPLLRAITAAVEPRMGERICDPACGTGGFLLESRRFIAERTDRKTPSGSGRSVYAGVEIVPDTARLCLMSLHLRGITDEEIDIRVGDALMSSPEPIFDVVLTNPPFGRRSSMTFTNESRSDSDRLVYRRDDFVATTSNKQLNFLQHVMSILAPTGRAAVVVPDGTLSEGGAGEAIRRVLLERFDVHTLLRLPAGIFYAGSVKSSVLFFDRKPAKSRREAGSIWTYDLRSGHRFSLRSDPLTDEALTDFVERYGGKGRRARKESERFKRFAVTEVLASERCSLDIGIIGQGAHAAQDEPPASIATDIIDRLEAAADAIRAVEQQLDERP